MLKCVFVEILVIIDVFIVLMCCHFDNRSFKYEVLIKNILKFLMSFWRIISYEFFQDGVAERNFPPATYTSSFTPEWVVQINDQMRTIDIVSIVLIII